MNDLENQIHAARSSRARKIKELAIRMIWIKFQREGIHAYPAAATDPKLEDVKFLAHPHRHIFHFNVGIEIFHNDREIEFIQFKRWIENIYRNSLLQLDNKSCEMISDDLFDIIAQQYPNRDIEISVSEDGENGSLIKYYK